MGSHSVRKQIARVATDQQGVVTTDQLATVGATPKLIRLLTEQGHLVREARGVYVIAGAPRTTRQRLEVALRSRSAALASGRTAAWLHRFEGVAQPLVPEITVPSTASGRNPVAKVRRSQHFSNIATVDVDGAPVATIEETIFRMAEYVSPRRIGRFLDTALLLDAGASDILGEIYLRHLGERMRGMARLRPVLLERLAEGAVAESDLEALANEVFVDQPIPEMVRQAPIPWAPAAGRVDRFIPEWRLIIELDGRRWHARVDQFEQDRIRDNAATANGFAVLRFTWRMLNAEPQRCIDLVVASGARATGRVA